MIFVSLSFSLFLCLGARHSIGIILRASVPFVRSNPSFNCRTGFLPKASFIGFLRRSRSIYRSNYRRARSTVGEDSNLFSHSLLFFFCLPSCISVHSNLSMPGSLIKTFLRAGAFVASSTIHRRGFFLSPESERGIDLAVDADLWRIDIAWRGAILINARTALPLISSPVPPLSLSWPSSHSEDGGTSRSPQASHLRGRQYKDSLSFARWSTFAVNRVGFVSLDNLNANIVQSK